MPRSTLTPKQEAFVCAYLANGRNAAAAYRECYATTATPRRAGVAGAKLLKNPRAAVADPAAADRLLMMLAEAMRGERRVSGVDRDVP
jgi:phage terminase small subunit